MTIGEREHAVLQAVLTGELDREAPEVRALSDASAEFRGRLERLSHVAHGLDRAGEEARATLADAARRSGFAGEERVPATLAELRAGGSNGSNGSQRATGGPRWRWHLAAAAAVTVTLVSWFALGRRPPAEEPVFLSGGGIRLEHPVGAVDALLPFRWRHALPPGGHFRVRVFDADDPDTPLVESARLYAPEWSPAASLATSWPASIRWEVRAVDATQQPVDFGWAQASRD